MQIETKIYYGEVPPITSPLGMQYLLAINGIFLHAENSFFKVIVKTDIGFEAVEGAKYLDSKIELKEQPSSKLFLDIFTEFEKSPDKEKVVIVIWNAKTKLFRFCIPKQTGCSVSVSYEIPELLEDEIVVLECHSHPNMAAFFSDVDDVDNQGFKAYGVVAVNVGKVDDYKLRLGVYGRFFEIGIYDIFEEAE